MKKKITITFILLGIFILSYYLFEPVFHYYAGLKEMPNLKEINLETKHNKTIEQEADDLLKKYFKSLQTPSISIAIGVNDSIAWSNSIGYADVENKTLVNSKTKYRIGSISKCLTAVAMGKLFENKTLTPNTIVEKHVPYAANNLAKLTVYELASHTSGIRNYGSSLGFPIWEFYNNDQYNSIEESVAIFNDDKLLFEPSTDFNYSTYNYTLLSAVMEGATKLDYLELMKKSVFTPLNLTETMPDEAISKSKNIAQFYDIDEQNISKAYNTNSSNKWAGGGFLSTPTDLVKFGNSVLNERTINAQTTKLLFEPVKLKNGKINEQNYGLGWRNDIRNDIIKDKRKVRVIHHGGSATGSIAMLILLPEYNTSVAVAMNRSGSSSDLFDISFRIAELFIEEQISTTNNI